MNTPSQREIHDRLLVLIRRAQPCAADLRAPVRDLTRRQPASALPTPLSLLVLQHPQGGLLEAYIKHLSSNP